MLQLAVIPLYLQFIGKEAYGLYATYYVLLGLVQILDLGFSPTMNRDMARYSVQPDKASEARNLARTLEIVYIAIGVVIGLGIALLAPLIATRWLGASNLPTAMRTQAVMLMGVLAFMQWPLTLYQGGLIGLQRQVRLVVLQTVMGTLRHGGAVLALWFISPTLQTLLIWHCVFAALHTILIAALFWRSLPRVHSRPKFDTHLLTSVRRFATGMSLGSVVAIVLTQLPGVLLIRLLTAQSFADYALAGNLSTVVGLLIAPIYNAVAPRITALVASGDEALLRRFYHLSTQTMSVVVLPVGVLVAFFSFDLALIWQRNLALATSIAPIASILVIGAICHSWTHIPYALQIAHGWTRIGVQISLVLIVICIPATVLLTRLWGALGAALAWALLFVVYLALVGPLTHRRELPGELAAWYGQDIALPALAVVAVVGLSRLLIPQRTVPDWGMLGVLIGVWAAAAAAAAFASSSVRSWLLGSLRRSVIAS